MKVEIPVGGAVLTQSECEAIYDLIDMTSGGNPEYVFSENTTGEPSDPLDPTASGFAKIYSAAGQPVPEILR